MTACQWSDLDVLTAFVMGALVCFAVSTLVIVGRR